MPLADAATGLRAALLAVALATMAPTGANAKAPSSPDAARDPADGTIRITGGDELEALLTVWQRGFKARHPAIRFRNRLTGTDSAIYGLEMRTSDIAVLGRRIHPFELYGTYERSWMFPVEIEVATGSSNKPGHSPAYAVFVHRDNPLPSLTVRQLDGIFGTARDGGWDSLKWVPGNGRDADGNIRTWRQLGIGGRYRERSIEPIGPPLEGAGAVSDFQSLVLRGGAKWNEALREYVSGKALLAAIASNPFAIGYGAHADIPSRVRVVPIAANDSSPAVFPTPAAVASRGYPLSRPIYLYFTTDDAEGDPAPADPKVIDFVRYILSAEGQAAVSLGGTYHPLPSRLAARQVVKLERAASPGQRPAERPLVQPSRPVRQLSHMADGDAAHQGASWLLRIRI